MKARPTPLADDWHSLNGPALFEADFAAWMKSLSRRARAAEATMHWRDLGPFAISAYGLHIDLMGTYRFRLHRNNPPLVLPDDCTPEGFYRMAVAVRHQQVGVHTPMIITSYDRLSPFSRFIYSRMTERVAASAGFGQQKAKNDGLGDGLEDVDDGLGGGDDGLDDLDDGLGGLALALVDDDGLGLGDGL